jgi:type I restriction enzyme S subunit
MGNLTFGAFNFNKLEYVDKNHVENYESLILKKGDFLFNTRNSEDLVGKCAVWREDFPEAIFDNNILRMRFKTDKIWNANYISYLLNSYYGRKRLEGIIKRTTSVAAIYYKDLRSYKLPLPPLPEQQKIASVLSKIDELIQKTDQIIEQTERLKKGLMQRLLTKGIGHTKFKKISLFPKYIQLDIPLEWKLVTFGEVSKRITYGFTNPMPHTEEGPWLVTAKDIKNGNINYETSEKTSWKAFKEELSDKSRPKKGTVLITKDGTLGEVGIVDREGICINQSVASIEPNDTILPEFLALSLQSPSIEKIIDVSSPATTIRHIYITEIAKWKFGLPSLFEQKKILTVIATYDAFLKNKKMKRKIIVDLKIGLMQNLLTGKIRVKV